MALEQAGGKSLDKLIKKIKDKYPNYNFDNFLEGDSNRLARSAGIAVSNKPGGTSFNPLLIYGGVGLGKTHLMHAVGNEILKNEPNKRAKVKQVKIKARIQYQQDQKEMDLPGTRSQLNVQIGEGSVRVKLDKTGYEIFTKATKIEIDGEVFRIVSDPSKVGPFSVKFYTLYLRRA